MTENESALPFNRSQRNEPAGISQPESVENTSQLVIIEGGKQDDWNHNYVMVSREIVPPGCTDIKIGAYQLSLVGRWEEEGPNLSPIYQAESLLYPSDAIHIDQNLMWVQGLRPTSLLTFDGRIYHDTSIFNTKDSSNSNSYRLEFFLDSLFQEFGNLENFVYSYFKS